MTKHNLALRIEVSSTAGKQIVVFHLDPLNLIGVDATRCLLGMVVSLVGVFDPTYVGKDPIIGSFDLRQNGKDAYVDVVHEGIAMGAPGWSPEKWQSFLLFLDATAIHLGWPKIELPEEGESDSSGG